MLKVGSRCVFRAHETKELVTFARIGPELGCERQAVRTLSSVSNSNYLCSQ